MAATFKTLLNNDVVNTRTLLHEAIPITGTIVRPGVGSYSDSSTLVEKNIKTYMHGMFESTYDYPYLSSSANHIFDVTYGYTSALSGASNTQNAKKLNIYNQFAQVLMGYDEAGSIRKFDSDGTLTNDANDDGLMNSCFFLSFSRLLTKDEIKKGSFTLQMYPSGSVDSLGATTLILGDYGALNEYRTSPSGDYGLIFTASADAPTTDALIAAGASNTKSVGLIFYQAGVLVLTSSFFQGATSFGYKGSSTTVNWGDGSAEGSGSATGVYVDREFVYSNATNSTITLTNHGYSNNEVVYVYGDSNTTQFPVGHYGVSNVTDNTFQLWEELENYNLVDTTAAGTFQIAARGDAMGGGLVVDIGTATVETVLVNSNPAHALHSGTIEDLAKGFRQRWSDCDFQNTIELNSTVYFARVNHNEFNYSSNPTYVSSSKLVVKKTLDDLPVTYITTVGLYSPDNELLAVAKLSEPLRKDPNTELTLRVRLDY